MNFIFRYLLLELIYLNRFGRLLFLLDLWLSYWDLIKQRVNKEGRHLYYWVVKGVENIENTEMIWRLPLQGQESVIVLLDCG